MGSETVGAIIPGFGFIRIIIKMQLQKTESSFKPKFKESTRELIIRKLTERHPQPEKAQAIADSVDNYLNSGCKITE